MNYIQDIDLDILNFIQQYFRNDFLDSFFSTITVLGNSGILWIIIAAGLLIFKRTRRCGIMMSLALILSLVIGNITLKPLVARIRPFDVNQLIEIIINKPEDFSFPSGHTMSSFAAATVIFMNYRKTGIAALVLASLIAFSRLYLYVHYPSDVIAGLAIGIFIGIISVNIVRKFTRPDEF